MNTYPNKSILYLVFTGLLFLVLQVAFLPLYGGTSLPHKMNYQAVARDASGNPLVSATISVRFSIHSGTAGGTIEYQETQSLTTNVFGLFSAAIGSGTVTLGTWSGIGWNSSIEHFLQVEMDPAGGSAWLDMGTSQLLSVPYSLVSEYSTVSTTSLDNQWYFNGTDIWNLNTGGKVGIGTTVPTLPVDVKSASGTGSSTTPVLGVQATQPTGTLYDGAAILGANYVDDWYGVGGEFTGGYMGLKAYVNPTGSQSYYGLYGRVNGGSGTNVGVYGTSDQVGVNGFTNGSGTGLTTYYGPSFDETIGIFGQGQTNSTTNGISYGVAGQSYSSTSHINVGVYGYAVSASGTNSRNWGVCGVSDDPVASCGVLGISDASTGTNGHAMEGDVLSGTSQVAVFGYTSGATASDYAGYFSGNLYATTASSGIKAFKIDDPRDPGNKYIMHSSVESNEMMNVYSGNITTDANGFAVVYLPDYFETINKDFRYQFTCINQFAQAIVFEKITNNHFTIQTDKPSVEVSWMVTGVRQDPLANKYRIQDVVDKPEGEKGTYLTPELYGKTMEYATQKPSYLEKKAPVHPIRSVLDDPKMKQRHTGMKGN